MLAHIEIPPEAMKAIQQGIEREDPITNLEWLGVPLRVLHQLNGDGIVTIKDLMARSQKSLLTISSFGAVSLEQLLRGLSQYDRLETIEEQQIDPRMRRRISRLRG